MQITGKITDKRYKCTSCGHEHTLSTNHYGETYGCCPSCGWKHRLGPGRHVCLETLPEGWGTPAPWAIIKLGDLCAIQRPVC